MASTTTLQLYAIDDLDGLYFFREPDEVRRFLTTYPFLIPLLVEARDVIAQHFPAATRVALNLLYDRESENEDDTELFALVQTSLPPEEARPLLDRFTQEWWLRVFRRAQGRLEFNLWYV